MSNLEKRNQFIFYNSEDGTIKVYVTVEDGTIWLSQKDMAELFEVDIRTINDHLKNIFDTKELDMFSTIRKIRIVQKEGNRNVEREIMHYNLEVVISVGYRVNSHKATRFRQWATKVLKEYMIKGFILDDERLKQGNQLFGKDYFDELLERIREIRASERRFYQKITDIYSQCSYDYDPASQITKDFFSMCQNKLEYAVCRMTAAEIVNTRAKYNLPNMGLTTWDNQKKGGKIYKKNVSIAKNYLTEEEISDLNRLVSMFLDYAEGLVKKSQAMSMQNWVERLDNFLRFNEYEILENYGSISHDEAKKNAVAQYELFKPIQEENYKSDFDKAVEEIIKSGKLPKEALINLRKSYPNFDSKLKQALNFKPKD